MREFILTALLEKDAPSDVAIAFIKKEIKKVFK